MRRPPPSPLSPTLPRDRATSIVGYRSTQFAIASKLFQARSSSRSRLFPRSCVAPKPKMFNYENIHEVFPADLSNPYGRNFQHDIETNRKSFDGVLFIDRVLKAVGITKGKTWQCFLLLCISMLTVYSKSLPAQDRQCAQTTTPTSLRVRHVNASQALPLLLYPTRL